MKRNAILHGVGAVCSALVYPFFALPFYTITVKPDQLADSVKALGAPVGATSGYSFLEEALKQPDGTALAKFTTVIALITLILAGIAFLACVFALLNDFEVIKNEKVAKIANYVAFGSAVLLALSCILTLIGNACFVAKDLKDQLAPVNAMLAAMSGSISATAGWALSVITTVLGLGTAATTALTLCKNKQ